jgi:hypothetical protein
MSTIKQQVYDVIRNSPQALFAEDVSHRMPNAKLSSVKSSCWALVDEGRVKAAKKNRQDSKIAHVYYVSDNQLQGLEGLTPYEKRPTGPRKKPGEEAAVEDVMIAIPLAENKTDMVTIEQARKIYRQLATLFEVKK